MPKPAAPHVLLHFGEHQLDLARQRLWRGPTAVELRPKAWQALLHLVQQPGALVRGDELFELLWPQQDVGPKALTNLIGELRSALGDDPAAPHIIQTVHRRGYRLIAPLRHGSVASALRSATVSGLPSPPVSGRPDPTAAGSAATAPARGPCLFVGRETELATLARLLDAACNGQRQMLLLGGEAGLGKTALIDAFVARLGPAGVLLGRGQCVEQAGEREAFGPLLGLLAHLAAGPGAAQVLPQLRRCAPSWLVQMPWLLGEQGASEAQQLRRKLGGAGAGRMVRECGALLETLSLQTPLVLVLEDLHWADAATVDLLAHLAQGQAPARLLLLASHQPVQAALRDHPMVGMARRLHAQRQLVPLHLQPLAAPEVAALLDQRFASPLLTRQLAPLALQHSEGNPLFLTAALDHLVDRGWLVPAVARTGIEVAGDDTGKAIDSDGDSSSGWRLTVDLHHLHLGLPEHLRLMVAARFEDLDAPTRELLQAASAIGMQFSVQTLQAALDRPALALEQACHALAQRQLFLRALPPVHWPDGSAGSGYAFVHDVYRRVLYDALPAARRRDLHRRIAERLEAGFGARAAEVAGPLASAYARAGLPEATARVLEMAAGVSAQRFAYAEAADALEASLQQLALLPDSEDHARTATRLNLALGPVTLAARGLAHPRALQAFQAAEALARRTGATRELLRAQLGACMNHLLGGSPQAGRKLAMDFVPLAEAHHPTLAAVAHAFAGLADLGAGHLLDARDHFEQALQRVPEPGIPMFLDLHTLARVHLGRTLCHLGLLAEGREQLRAAETHSRDTGVPLDLIQTLYWVADTHRVLGLHARATALFDEVVARADEQVLPTYSTSARIGRLACTQRLGGDGSPAALTALVQQVRLPGDRWAEVSFSVLLAEAYRAQGDTAAALACIEHGFAQEATGPLFSAELHRVRAELQAESQQPGLAEAGLLAAVAIARGQQARLHELRSAASLCRHAAVHGEGESGRARRLLTAACTAFTEDAECPDLQAARAWLAAA
jgi:DNA-binding winged helix-turn-helix (wHTH) protein